ncbi:MAG TPA: hypothetical protein VGK19_18805 [Capsulimonadaceae bacterium]|jgi:Mg/Co/Ni transporter MgtE
MTNQDFETLYQNVCAALRKPLSDAGGVGLTAAFQHCTSAEVGEIVAKLTPMEALTVFDWLDDVRATAMLAELPDAHVTYILANAPAGRIAHLSVEPADHKIGL